MIDAPFFQHFITSEIHVCFDLLSQIGSGVSPHPLYMAHVQSVDELCPNINDGRRIEPQAFLVGQYVGDLVQLWIYQHPWVICHVSAELLSCEFAGFASFLTSLLKFAEGELPQI